MAPLIRKLLGGGELGKLVKFAPLMAGNVPVNCAAGNEVKFAPLPYKVSKYPLATLRVFVPIFNWLSFLGTK